MLSNRVKEYRDRKGESLRDLGEAVGMDPTQLSKLERGMRGCGDEFKLRLAEHFDVAVTELFFQRNVDSQATGAAR